LAWQKWPVRFGLCDFPCPIPDLDPDSDVVGGRGDDFRGAFYFGSKGESYCLGDMRCRGRYGLGDGEFWSTLLEGVAMGVRTRFC
jgi:hypothetical protein